MRLYYGYTLLEIMPDIDPDTGRLKEVNSIERRNVLPEQGIVVKRQGLWLPHWDIRSAAYRKRYVLIKTGDIWDSSRPRRHLSSPKSLRLRTT